MLLKQLSCAIIIVFLLSCATKNNRRKNNDKANNLDSLKVIDTLYRVTKNDDKSINISSYVKLTKNIKIEILTINKVVDSSSRYFGLFERDCGKWNLTKQNVIDILHLSEPIDGHEWHYDFQFLPCRYSGEMKVEGKLVTYSINAGAVSNINYKDTSVTIGYKSKDYRKYFISGKSSPSEYK